MEQKDFKVFFILGLFSTLLLSFSYWKYQKMDDFIFMWISFLATCYCSNNIEWRKKKNA